MNRAANVYRFGSQVVDGDGSMRDLLGGKGAGLAEMTSLSVPVPPGFTLTTEVCREYRHSGVVSSRHLAELSEGMAWLENECGKRFGDAIDPLLVSVRSGAPVSMPGMMDTILNVGLNDVSVCGLAAKSGSEEFAYDSYKRLLHMFGSVVLGVPKEAFEKVRHGVSTDGGAANGSSKMVEALRRDISIFKMLIESIRAKRFRKALQSSCRWL